MATPHGYQQLHLEEVSQVILRRKKTGALQLDITAIGFVTRQGHKNPRLLRRSTTELPGDGVQDYDFVVDVPVHETLYGLSSMVATESWKGYPAALRGIRVHSAYVTLERRFSSE
jgi:hypothetical protein